MLQAHDVLRHYALQLLAAKRQAPDACPVDGAGGAPPGSAAAAAAVVAGSGGGGLAGLRCLDKGPLEACLCVVLLALSVVMAGTGGWQWLKHDAVA